MGSDIEHKDISFEAIMLMGDADLMEINLQLMSDLLLSKSGSIHERRSRHDKQYVQMYSTNPDLIYSDSFAFPRASG